MVPVGATQKAFGCIDTGVKLGYNALMIANDQIGRLIKGNREERKMTQARLAELAGLTVQSISRYENSREVPSADARIRIAKALTLPIETLL